MKLFNTAVPYILCFTPLTMAQRPGAINRRALQEQNHHYALLAAREAFIEELAARERESELYVRALEDYPQLNIGPRALTCPACEDKLIGGRCPNEKCPSNNKRGAHGSSGGHMIV